MTDVSTRHERTTQRTTGGAAGPGAPGGDALRERLLRAAAAVFARQGYDGTKIMDVVRESGLSTGAVYGRFRSKNDLLREAIITRSTAAARVGVEGLHRVADFIAAGVSRTDAPLSDVEALRLEAYVTARREPEVAKALAEAHELFQQRMAPVLAAARRDGTVADDVDPDAALFLVRILHLGLLLHRGSGLPGPDEDAWQALVARVVASIGQPPQPPPSEEDDR
ncbi:MAG TPA: helix-turn-helix domain-containing protein [Acidimicrobiales bacterium]|nr:helix-turn-helix domain-containing protein [Acidimicrobiales bacterium]